MYYLYKMRLYPSSFNRKMDVKYYAIGEKPELIS